MQKETTFSGCAENKDFYPFHAVPLLGKITHMGSDQKWANFGVS